MEKKPKTPTPSKTEQQQPEASSERRTTDRRKAKGDGFTYIPMVGWYCRREETRRGDDTLK